MKLIATVFGIAAAFPVVAYSTTAPDSVARTCVHDTISDAEDVNMGVYIHAENMASELKFRELLTPEYQKYKHDWNLLNDSTYSGEYPLKKYYHISEKAFEDNGESIIQTYGSYLSEFKEQLKLTDNYTFCTFYDWFAIRGRNIFSKWHLEYKAPVIRLPARVQGAFYGQFGWFILYDNNQVIWITAKISLNRMKYRYGDREYQEMIRSLKFPKDKRASAISEEMTVRLLSKTPMYPLAGKYHTLLQYYGKPMELPTVMPNRENFFYSKDGVCVIGYNLTPEFFKLLSDTLQIEDARGEDK